VDPGIGRRADRRRGADTASFVVVAGVDRKARRSRDRQLVAKSVSSLIGTGTTLAK
jgi:hypothetical protein